MTEEVTSSAPGWLAFSAGPVLPPGWHCSGQPVIRNRGDEAFLCGGSSEHSACGFGLQGPLGPEVPHPTSLSASMS